MWTRTGGCQRGRPNERGCGSKRVQGLTPRSFPSWSQRTKAFTYLPPFFLSPMDWQRGQLLASLQLDSYLARRHHAKICPAPHPFLFLSFVSPVHEGRRPPERRTIAWSAPSIMHQKPLVVGVWPMCHPSSKIGFMEKNLSSEMSRLRTSAAGRCNTPKRACTTTPEKKPSDVQKRTTTVRSEAGRPKCPLNERCPRGCHSPQTRLKRTSTWRPRWALQAMTDAGLTGSTLHNNNRTPTEPRRHEHGQRPRHDTPSHTTVRLSVNPAHLVRPASPTTLPRESHHQTTCTRGAPVDPSPRQGR